MKLSSMNIHYTIDSFFLCIYIISISKIRVTLHLVRIFYFLNKSVKRSAGSVCVLTFEQVVY